MTVLRLVTDTNDGAPPADLDGLMREARDAREVLDAALPDDDGLKTCVEAVAFALRVRLD